MFDVAARSTTNRLLAALPAEERERVCARLEPVVLAFKQGLCEPDVPIAYVYFVERGVCSLVQDMIDGAVIEVSTIGPEGMVGLPVYLGAESMSSRVFVQLPGDALRVDAATFRDLAVPGSLLHLLLGRYTQALMGQMAQGVACNRLHSIEERCARWLLQTHDRVHADRFPLTQEFLGEMLGVRRASVNVAAGILQKAGFIRYSRGVITILDRDGLESASCECYRLVEAEYVRLIG